MIYPTTLWVLISIPSWFILSNAQPNIIFMIFDDISFGDVSYNGGPIPTPYIDTLANNNSIKLNYHYTETTCTPSRSALYTGRYAFKAGINRNAQHRVAKTLDPNLVLYPEILNNNGYRTFFAGKWHVGYTFSNTIPPTRGFDEGLYGLNRVVYKSRTSTTNWNTYDDVYPTSSQRILNQRNSLFPNGPPALHEMYKIVNGRNVPDGLSNDTHNNDTWVETLYTNAILHFIEDQTNNQPFYIQYNLLTPHDPITEPPALDPNWIYDTSVCDIAILPATQQKICRMMLFAQERMNEIIDKVQEKGLYDNTIFVVISDNAHNEGQSLPMRGTKGSYNEGGIRTPAFMFGGYIEDLLSTEGSTHCEYNGLFHISDWYNFFTDLGGIVHSESDSQHQLEILDDIKCSCGVYPNCQDGDYQKRTEIISMRLCGNEDSLAIDRYPDKVYHGAYIIDWPWKLIVNGSLDTDCSPNGRTTRNWQRFNSMPYFDPIRYYEPNQQVYDNYYTPKIAAGLGHLYGSECLEALAGSADIDDPDYAPFAYQEFMLYNLATDRIEACNVDNQTVKNILFEKLEDASFGWNADAASDEPTPGAMLAQIRSYDCVNDVWYPTPWDQNNEDQCGAVADTANDITSRDCRNLWRILNRLKSRCPGSSPLGIAEIDFDELTLEALWWGLGIGIGGILLICTIIAISIRYCCKGKKEKETLEKQIDDVVKRVESVMKGESELNLGGPDDIVSAASIEYDDGQSIEFGNQTAETAKATV